MRTPRVEAASEPAAQLKRYRVGTDRARSPAETLELLLPLLERFGITRVANLTGLDEVGLPTVSVCRPNSRSIAVSQGKGLTLEAAKVSGIMEAIECHHAEHVDRPLRYCSLAELSRSHAVVDVDRLPRLWTSSFSASQRILWIEGIEYGTERPLWVPFECVHTDYTLPLPSGSGAFVMSSNGLASGNHRLEAALHGLCECIERDATCLWKMAGNERRVQSLVDPSTVDDPACRGVLERFDKAGLDVLIFDMTSDIRVAAFRCEVAERDGYASLRPVPPLPGSGCHPRRDISLLRALTEAAQSRLTFISGSRDDITQSFYDRASVSAAFAQFDALRSAQQPPRDFRAVPTSDEASFDGDLASVVHELRKAGVGQPVFVHITAAELPIAVVRVVVPGLEPMPEAPGFVPGPRALGARQHAAQEAESRHRLGGVSARA